MGWMSGMDPLPPLHGWPWTAAPHKPACPCLACADWRAERRAQGLRGRWPQPAKDWRGVEFPQ